MLAAEVVAHRVRKKLDFGGWEEGSSSAIWAKDIRHLILAQDANADASLVGDIREGSLHEIASDQPLGNIPSKSQSTALQSPPNDQYDTESLVGYESSGSSRASSPTPSELEEIEQDPSLSVKPKSIPKPVYLAQIGTLIRGSGGMKANDNEESDRIKMALDVAEDLIRRKKAFGFELGKHT